MKTTLKSRIALTIVTVVMALSMFACADGNGIMSNNSQAKMAYDYAQCVREAGNDLTAVNNCK